MIRRFRCKDMQALFEGGHPQRFRAIETVATRKLAMLDAAKTLDFMRSPPGKRLEALKATRQARVACASTTSGGCASCGSKQVRTRSRSWTTTEGVWRRGEL